MQDKPLSTEELIAQDVGGRSPAGAMAGIDCRAGAALVAVPAVDRIAPALRVRLRRVQRHRDPRHPPGLRPAAGLPRLPRRSGARRATACRLPTSPSAWPPRPAPPTCSSPTSSWRNARATSPASTWSPPASGIPLLLEAARRALGPALAVIALAFLAYSVAGPWMPALLAHRGVSFSALANHQWITTEGVFGIALGVSTSFVFLFVLFGALLERAGAGHYFIQLAFSLLGHLRGGPAKAAVVSSALTGVISGSSIANVVTTGTFTIPMMKKVGFSKEKAGAVEVASSVNGQDHAAGDGRRRLPDGRVRRHALRGDHQARLPAGGDLLHRAVLHRPPRSAEARHAADRRAPAQALAAPPDRLRLRRRADLRPVTGGLLRPRLAQAGAQAITPCRASARCSRWPTSAS